MKLIACALACVAVGVAGCGGGCGGGTLGTPGSGGNGVGVLDGVGGNVGVGVGGAGGGAASSGIGGDGAPAGGNGGPTGRGGSGGATMVCPPPRPPLCGPLCGNGLVDTCTRGIVPECTAYDLAEECDGDQFGAASCGSYGFGSGLLTCNSNCLIDPNPCSDCLPPGGGLIDCRPVPITFPDLTGFAIAATDTEVGLAQIDQNAINTSRLTFARLDAQLALINAVGIEDTNQPGPLEGNINSVAVAPISGGWLIAGCGGSEVFVHLVDTTGKKLARTVVAADGGACAPGMLSLVTQAQPGGTTLLLWVTVYGPTTALIAADGRSAGPPALLTFSRELGGYPRAAWISDAFYVVAPVSQNTGRAYEQGAQILRVAPDGKTTLFADILRDQWVAEPAFVSGAADLRLTYNGLPVGGRTELDVAVLWRRLGPSGELLAPPVALGFYPYFLGRAPAVAFGDDTVILLSGAEKEDLAIMRVDKEGTVVTLAHDIAIAPTYPPYAFDMVRRGPEVVVAWPSAGAVKLARIAP
jgi:hypothetical protein